MFGVTHCGSCSILVPEILGKVSQVDHAIATQYKTVLNQVLQFARIPRVIVTHEQLHDGLVNSPNRFALLGIEALDEIFHEIGYVFFSLVQGRNRQPNNRKPEIEVIAKFTSTD